MPERARIGILSRHAVPNYGSVLQACALQWALEDLGYDACYLNYRLFRDQPLAAARRESGLPAALLRSIPKAVSENRFESMRKRLLSQTSVVHTGDELRTLSGAFDALCVGGDQVWNVLSDGAVDGAYLLDFADADIPRFSYASSLGSGRIAESDRERFSTALSHFDRVSVREVSGVEALAGIGIDSTVVVDPVHLFSVETWEKRIPFAAPKGLEPGNFILVYNLHPDDEFRSYLGETLDGSPVPVVSIRPTLRGSYGRNVFYPEPGEFLWMFRNARCVYTDSFHGTAFSLLFDTPFVEWVPETNNDRNLSLLSTYGLLDRVAQRLPAGAATRMDGRWEDVNERLAERRADSTRFLAEAVREIAPS